MNIFENENIFQLEVIQDMIRLNPIQENPPNPADLFVTFTFNKNGPFPMLDTSNDKPKPRGIHLAKSILFALTPELIQEMRTNFTVSFDLKKRINEEMRNILVQEKEIDLGNPLSVKIGYGEVCLVDLYNELLQSALYNGPPSTKFLMDYVDIFDLDKKLVGCIKICIRISCYGKFVVSTLSLVSNSHGKKKGEKSLSKNKSGKKGEKSSSKNREGKLKKVDSPSTKRTHAESKNKKGTNQRNQSKNARIESSSNEFYATPKHKITCNCGMKEESSEEYNMKVLIRKNVTKINYLAEKKNRNEPDPESEKYQNDSTDNEAAIGYEVSDVLQLGDERTSSNIQYGNVDFVGDAFLVPKADTITFDDM